jgi:hypothetical protein
MGPSLRGTSLTSGVARPGTRDTNRPTTREQIVDTTIVPSRTSSLHSRITQPLPTTITKSNNRPTPKTLTHAYMVCGVGREPSQWVKAPPPSHGKIQHMKGAVGQFWLPEILGSSPRLESDNEIARALHSAMRVSPCHMVIAPYQIPNMVPGLLSPRCRNLYRPQSTSLHPPLVCPPTGLSTHLVRHCSTCLVSCR